MERLRTDSAEYSPIVETIVSRPPSWTVRYGTFALAGFILVVFLLANLIAYNDIVEGGVLVTTENPIVVLKSKRNGEISRLLVRNGDSVRKGQILAVLNTTASFDDVQRAKLILTQLGDGTGTSLVEMERNYPTDLRLGDLQDDYLDFFLKYNEFLVNDSLVPLAKERDNLGRQMSGQENLLRSKKNQLAILESQSELSEKDLHRSKTLFEKGVISQKEHEEAMKAHLQLLEQRELLSGEIYASRILLDQTGSVTDQSALRELAFSTSNRQIFIQAHQALGNAIEDWEDRNLIRSPIDGTANGHNLWEPFQNVGNGDIIFSIVPHGETSGRGTIDVPVERFSKVAEGQEVVIKLSSFPYQQYGHLYGRVSGMSSVPDQQEQVYTVFVDIPNFRTSYAKNIKIEQQMVGRAQIVTEKLSLAQRIFYGMRRILEPND